MTIEEKIEAALFGHARVMSVTGSPPLAWPNVTFPEDGATKPSTYIEVKLLPNNNTRVVSKGSGPHFRQGILQFVVRTPLRVGPTVATTIAGEIAEHFPADLDLFEDGMRLRIQQAPDVDQAEVSADEVSWAARVAVRYETFA